jgi:hypothetical protein
MPMACTSIRARTPTLTRIAASTRCGNSTRAGVEAYPDLRVEPLEIMTNGDRALVWASWRGHGAGSGVPIEMEMAQVWTVEDGKIRRIAEFSDRDEGLEAAGLRDRPDGSN